jgi:hypothetical protein
VLFRRLALEYVNQYRDGGNARLAVHRDRERPIFVGDELRSMIERLPRLAAEPRDLTRYLLDYPKATLGNATDFLYWQETGSDGGRVEDAVRHPLLLDRTRTSHPRGRSSAPAGVLAGDGQPQPVRWLERIHRSRHSWPGAE